jgi:nitroreductase
LSLAYGVNQRKHHNLTVNNFRQEEHLKAVDSSMQFYDVIRRRRSVRKFKPDVVDNEIVKRVLEAGMWAPSAGNMQPWRFVVVQDRELKKRLADVHTEFSRKAWSTFEPKTERDLASRGGVWRKEYLVDVPVWIVTCYRLTVQKGFDEVAFASAWCAVENMLLAATAEGLGCCPYTLAEGEEQEIREVLPIPKDHKIAVIVHVGYTDVKVKAPLRREFGAIIGYDKFP